MWLLLFIYCGAFEDVNMPKMYSLSHMGPAFALYWIWDTSRLAPSGTTGLNTSSNLLPIWTIRPGYLFISLLLPMERSLYQIDPSAFDTRGKSLLYRAVHTSLTLILRSIRLINFKTHFSPLLLACLVAVAAARTTSTTNKSMVVTVRVFFNI